MMDVNRNKNKDAVLIDMENLPARRERMTSFDFGSDMVQTIFDDDPEI